MQIVHCLKYEQGIHTWRSVFGSGGLAALNDVNDFLDDSDTALSTYGLFQNFCSASVVVRLFNEHFRSASHSCHLFQSSAYPMAEILYITTIPWHAIHGLDNANP